MCTSGQVPAVLESSVNGRTGSTQTAFAPAVWDSKGPWLVLRLNGH